MKHISNSISAAKILFTDPPKKKKFGYYIYIYIFPYTSWTFAFASDFKWCAYMSLFCVRIDFHLVQLFFACMAACFIGESIFYVTAVYLVAQYARYEMRRMEALKEAEEKVKSNPVILEVKTRLVKLEETVDEIVAESKKQSSGSMTKNQVDTQNKSE
ncbi:hypothetical protein JRO89_XS02G0170800 [Xanthoceras sorbifolium]|uniref:Uncharacterized protein n=1 Tax=Xanthoceras sorbifolium TaxID=99658 RepID=A0ABQ8IG26_9ROSI|nr:hypothetical protein JRO89_XS02G0170800 [Xanthoceras sorbifolium]